MATLFRVMEIGHDEDLFGGSYCLLAQLKSLWRRAPIRLAPLRAARVRVIPIHPRIETTSTLMRQIMVDVTPWGITGTHPFKKANRCDESLRWRHLGRCTSGLDQASWVGPSKRRRMPLRYWSFVAGSHLCEAHIKSVAHRAISDARWKPCIKRVPPIPTTSTHPNVSTIPSYYTVSLDVTHMS